MTTVAEPRNQEQGPRLPEPGYRHTGLSWNNTLLVAAVAALGGVLLTVEGYLPWLRWPFLLYSAAVLGVVVWVGFFDITARRLTALLVVAGAFGLLTQWVGATRNVFWSYSQDSYWFVAPMFMFAATFGYGLTVAVLGPALVRAGLARKLRAWQALLLILAPLGLLVSSARGPSLSDAASFWTYYLGLAGVALVVALQSDLQTMLALWLAGIVVGAFSETLGAHSGLWRFSGDSGLPPAFLVLASWPLELTCHWGLSALLAKESLLPRRRYFVEPETYRPKPEHPMYVGGHEARVVVRQGEDKFALLEELLAVDALEALLLERCTRLAIAREELGIAIKSNFMFMYSEHDRSTFTDPALVEHLVDWLRERGFSKISVVEAQSAYGNYFLDREVENVARVVGYAPNGRYRIADLTLEKVPHEYDGPLGKHWVGATWKNADFRISFAKNKTHSWAWYTLTLKNIYGALPEQNKIREYHYLREIYAPTIDLLVAFPVDYGIIDAFESADGPFGIFADRHPNPTRTLIAGHNLVAVDWVGARKMGLDPMLSRYMQLAVQVFGKPAVVVDGNTDPYPNWCNVPKEVIDYWDHAEENYGFTNSVFLLLNRRYMSQKFRRRPLTKFLSALLPLVAPLGSLVYQMPPERKPAPESPDPPEPSA